MEDNNVKVLLSSNEIHILHSCITEHWEMPEYKNKLSSKNFELLESLRLNIFDVYQKECEHEFDFTKVELSVLVESYVIGFGLLVDAEDFETIVGFASEEGSKLLEKLRIHLVKIDQFSETTM